uniref:Uncharacterized protein n=1 Tax=Faxonius propinquus nudivirus TaxID=3139431 RepID=A0AAU8GFE4_9VIRU
MYFYEVVVGYIFLGILYDSPGMISNNVLINENENTSYNVLINENENTSYKLSPPAIYRNCINIKHYDVTMQLSDFSIKKI